MNWELDMVKDYFIWDAHGCFPLQPDADLSALTMYKDSGVRFLSINVGMDHDPWTNIIKIIARYRRYIDEHSDRYTLIKSTNDIRRANEDGKMAIALDLEGSDPLDGNLNMISLYYDLGVRQMLLAYNKDNKASGGCFGNNEGLSDYGREIIREMNRVGMLVDLSHMSDLAAKEAMEVSKSPAIFSHSNPRALCDNDRNITDELILACAKKGGVVGINGVGIFLGKDVDAKQLVNHIDYVANLVGTEHVGIGLDYVVDQEELVAYLKNNPDIYPPEKGFDLCKFIGPEEFPQITELLLKKGYSGKDISLILGENFLRVAEDVWK